MASITGKNLSVLVQAKKLAENRLLKDPDFAKRGGEQLLAVQAELKAQREESKQRGQIMRNHLIGKQLIIPRVRKIRSKQTV